MKRRLVAYVPLLRRFRWGHRLARAAFNFVALFDNRGSWRIDAGGELTMLHRLASTGLRAVLDVGAHEGEWSRFAAELHPGVTIHAFEPIGPTAERLRLTVAPFGGRVHVYEMALGATAEQRTVSLEARHSTMVSLLNEAHESADEVANVKVVRCDEFCREIGIEHIDLLKIDTEGFDHLVLAGAGSMLDSAIIDVIQFEYGTWALHTKFLLHDFYELLEGRGYVVGKLHPRGVAFGPYTLRLEDFRGLNFVAVSKARPDLVELLAES